MEEDNLLDPMDVVEAVLINPGGRGSYEKKCMCGRIISTKINMDKHLKSKRNGCLPPPNYMFGTQKRN